MKKPNLPFYLQLWFMPAVFWTLFVASLLAR